MIRMPYLTLVVLFFLAACQRDETVYSYGASGDDWILETLNGQPVAVPVTLALPKAGRLSGQGPCNQYSATQKAPYPWFEVGPLMSTKRACAALDFEATYFEALSKMTLSEVSGDVLILSNDEGSALEFTRKSPDGEDAQ